MGTRLSTSRVFLDTQVFVQAQFDYETAPFQALQKHIDSGRVRLYLTDLTLREIKANLEEAIAAALERLATTQKKAAILRRSQAAAGLLSEPDEGAIIRDVTAAFDQFLAACKPTILPVKDAFLQSVLNDYFERRPPFRLGQGQGGVP